MLRRYPCLLTVGLLAACGPADPSIEPGGLELAGPPGTLAPSLATTRDGRAVLTYLEAVTEERFAVKLAVREGPGEWSAPLTVVEGDSLFANWADFPAFLELADGAWLVHWLARVPGGAYAYHVRMSISRDEGATWAAPFTPHRDESATEHGFVSMAGWRGGAAVLWLDGREMVPEGANALGGTEEPAGPMTVRFTNVGPDGTLGRELSVDGRTCECCRTALARTASGLLAAYRDRSDSEIRDIAVARFTGEGWSEPRTLHADGWEIAGCPVDGPTVAAVGDTVAIAWFTAAERRPRVRLAFSVDGGASFGSPIAVDDGEPLGRADVLLLDGSGALVVWLEAAGGAADVRIRRVGRDGRPGPARTLATTGAGRASGFPSVLLVPDGLLVAWTETGEPGGVRVRRMSLD